MPRHHIVPQMYLRRFADDSKHLAMVSRDDLAMVRRVTVNNACNQIGFYEIPTDDLEVGVRAGHDPEQVETLLAQVEGKSKRYIDEILSGVFPPGPEARFRLSMYIALQITRGWIFRRGLDALSDLAAPHFLAVNATPERVRDMLGRMGQSNAASDVERMIAWLTGLEGPRPVLRQGHYVQHMLRQAIETIMPSLFQRTWRLLDFGQPMLITSDEPVAILPSLGDESVGPANSAAVWVPLDRQHALALTWSGTERVVPSGRTRAVQINGLVATQAHRWIFHHPDDRHLEELHLGPRTAVVDELVDTRTGSDKVRELHRFTKRPITS